MFILREKLQPESKEELIAVISGFMHRFGTDCDLNSIDVSKIKDMSELFQEKFLNQFDGDISKWNVSNVEDMRNMFTGSYFSGDISKWNVSKVKDMTDMFYRARYFNGDLSKWDVSKVETMEGMFAMASSFTGDLSKWKVNKKCNIWYIFKGCPLMNNPPQWWIDSEDKGPLK